MNNLKKEEGKQQLIRDLNRSTSHHFLVNESLYKSVLTGKSEHPATRNNMIE